MFATGIRDWWRRSKAGERASKGRIFDGIDAAVQGADCPVTISLHRQRSGLLRHCRLVSMSGRIVLLGTGTCEIEERRFASSVLVEAESSRFLFDIGRGVTLRLRQAGVRQNDLRHIVLSHYHPDHFSDLIPYLHGAAHAPDDRRTEDLHVYGPEGLAAVLEKLLSLAGLDSPASLIGFSVHAHRLEEICEIDGLEVEPRDLPPAGNHGIRVCYGGDVVALTGDSSYHEAEVDFVRGAKIAVIDSGHLTDEQIVSLAVQAGPEILVCSHIYRELDRAKLVDESRCGGFEGKIVVAEDRMEFPFGPSV